MELKLNSGRRGPRSNPQTKVDLLKAGTAKLHEVGYAASSVKDIVDIAKVPKGSFYNHFISKEEFGAEVIDYYFNEGIADLTKVLSDINNTPINRLKGHFNMLFIQFQSRDYMRGCMLGNLCLEIADHSLLIRAKIVTHLHTWEALLEKCIQEAQSKKEIDNIQSSGLLSRFILNTWEGALLRMRVEKNRKPFDDFMYIVFETILV